MTAVVNPPDAAATVDASTGRATSYRADLAEHTHTHILACLIKPYSVRE